jgi:hypothetical protein
MKGIIYCFKCLDSNLIYIGKSITSLSSRKAKHIYDSKHEHRIKPVHRIILANGGFSNFQIRVLKEVDDIEMLFFYEKKIIEDYKNNKNFKLMNKNN